MRNWLDTQFLYFKIVRLIKHKVNWVSPLERNFREAPRHVLSSRDYIENSFRLQSFHMSIIFCSPRCSPSSSRTHIDCYRFCLWAQYSTKFIEHEEASEEEACLTCALIRTY